MKSEINLIKGLNMPDIAELPDTYLIYDKCIPEICPRYNCTIPKIYIRG